MLKWPLLKFSIWSPLFCMVVMILNSCESFCKSDIHIKDVSQKLQSILSLGFYLPPMCLILANWPFALFNLVLSNSMCFLNFRFSSRVIPRYFAWVNRWIFWPLIQKFRFLVITLFFDRNSISSVLSLHALREILLAPLASGLCFLSQS